MSWQEGVAAAPARRAETADPLRRVAQFVLLERLGAGGMGVVFAAFDEKLERKVAIKLVATQPGAARAQERLLREAQAQAKLSHPNVVTVYEVGALPEGHLFIAMELVKGQTLRSWQRSEPRDWRDVLAKYIAAGEGLVAAHAVGIVHRDFKPDNILLGEDGRVRVADFGLAFAAEPRAPASRAPETSSVPADADQTSAEGPAAAAPAAAQAAAHAPSPSSAAPAAADAAARAPSPSSAAPAAVRPALTAAGGAAGTPGYMAPEQLSGEPVDARTDQFAFCVSLYEALYGERPFADFAFLQPPARSPNRREAAGEPDPGAAKASASSPSRHPPPSIPLRRSEPDPEHPRWLWNALLRGLALDPEARFGSMAELLAELTRNRGLVRRRALQATLAVGMVAMAGLTTVALTAHRAPAPCPLAEAELAGIWDPASKRQVEAALLGTATSFAPAVWASTQTALDRYAQRWLAAQQAACQATYVRHVQSEDLLDRRMECLAGHRRSLTATVEVLRQRPAKAVAHVGELLANLGEIQLCADTSVLLQLGRDGAQLASATPQLSAKIAEVREVLARSRALLASGEVPAAATALAEADHLAEGVASDPLRADLRFVAALVKLRRGEVAEAITQLDDAVELAVASHYDELPADIWLVLAREAGTRELRPAQIETWLGHGEAWVRRLNHPDDPRRLQLDIARGNLQLTAGKAQEAMVTLTRALQAGEALWGKDDPLLIPVLRDRALAQARLRQAAGAVADGERALALSIAAWGPHYPDLARTRRALGLLYIEQLGDVARGEQQVQQALQLFREQLGEASIEVANCEQVLSLAGQYRGDYAAALEHAERAERIYRTQLGAANPRWGEALLGVGALRYLRQDFTGSLQAYQEAYPVLRAALGEAHTTVAVLRSNTGETLLALGRPEAARQAFAEALQIVAAALGAKHADLALPLKGLGLAHLALGRPGEALAPLERALALRTSSTAASDPHEVAEIQWALARVLRALRRQPRRASELAAAAQDTYRALGPESQARVREIARWLRSPASPTPTPRAAEP